jgi:ABC-type transport system involved in multi-copper enzyme maturation permease subunit
MNKVSILLKRELRNSINLRAVYLGAFMVLLQTWFIIGSGCGKSILITGKMEFMYIVFSYNFFGAIAALALTFDSISRERKYKIMDLIITSGISKEQVIISKVVSCLIISLAFSLIYTTAISIVYLIFTKRLLIALLCFRYLIPVMIFLSIFQLMGLMLSIILRSSKKSLIVSIIIGGMLMPRLFVLVIEGIGKILQLNSDIMMVMELFSPALIMNALSGYESKNIIILASSIAIFYIAIMIVLSMVFFKKQDELNYGE